MDVEPPERRSAGRPFQFSLATLFVLTTALAVGFGVCFAVPASFAGVFVFILILILPAVAVVAMKYGTGSLPSFCIGALFPLSMCLAGLLFDPTLRSLLNRMQGHYGLSQEPHAWQAIGDWLVIVAVMGNDWRAMAVTSWFVAALVGLICVGVRRYLERRG